MKKVLVLILMASVSQGLNSEQQPTQYKYLNRLPESSQIKKECEQINRAWFVKGKVERACDNFDNAYHLYAQVMGNLKEHELGTIHIILWDKMIGPSGRRGEMPSNLKEVASKEMDYRCFSEVLSMFPDMNIEARKKEAGYLSTLADEIRQENIVRCD